MVNPRYNKHNREGIKQTKEVNFMAETTMLLKDQIKLAKKKYGYPNRNQPTPIKDTLPNLTKEGLKAEKKKGKRLKDLAQEYNVKPNYLSRHLTSQGIYWREL